MTIKWRSKKTSYQVSDFVKYKNSYVGDNSAVGNILSMLPAHDYIAGFSLQTEKKPYGVTVNYRANQSGVNNYYHFWSNKNPGEILERNAAVLFSLIQNVYAS